MENIQVLLLLLFSIKYITSVYNTQLQNELLAKEQQYEIEKQQIEKDLKELIEKVKRLMSKFPFGRTNTFERSVEVGRLLFAISDSTDLLDTWINVFIIIIYFYIYSG